MLLKNTIVLFPLVLLASCVAEEETIVVNSGMDTVFTLPSQLRELAAVDTADLKLEVRVNEQLINLPQTGTSPDLWSGVVNVPANRTSIVNVSWSQTYVTQDLTYDLTLAEQQKVVTVGSAATAVDFRLGGYNTNNHDWDDDGLSNLVELDQSRSPVAQVDAYIGPDGAYPTGLAHPFSSECGTQLPSAVRIQFAGDPTIESAPEDLTSWWCATYVTAGIDAAGVAVSLDGLQIIVNVLDDVFPITDSAVGRKYDDDSVEIFIDGNNSKGVNYDGIDDYQFIFLADGDNSSPLVKGPAGIINLQSSVQLTATGYKLRVYLPRSEVGIQNGQPFGINVEVNDDDDGGTRDSKFSWIGKENFDRSWTQPRAFGTSQIP